MSATDGSSRLDVEEHDDAGIRVIAVGGELDLATAPALAARVDAARSARARSVVVDLTGLEFCDSTGLRALLGAASEIRIAGGRLGVACPATGAVARMFDVTGAREWLPVYPDAASAVAALRGGGDLLAGAGAPPA